MTGVVFVDEGKFSFRTININIPMFKVVDLFYLAPIFNVCALLHVFFSLKFCLDRSDVFLIHIFFIEVILHRLLELLAFISRTAAALPLFVLEGFFFPVLEDF